MATFMATEANHEVGSDRISNFPDSVLSRILSSLPIKDAASTSILSTRWRHLFVSVFNIDVDFNLVPRSSRTVNSFATFMDKMLFFQTQGRIEQFRLIHIDITEIESSRVCGWISAALWRGVKDLDLGFNPNNFPVMLPTSLLFVSKTLVRLKLEFPVLMSLPIFVSLPSLKILELQYIKFEDDDSVKRLFSSCPILEDLSIVNCDWESVKCLEISNPSLKSLSIASYSASHVFDSIAIDLPRLVFFEYRDLISQNYSIVNMSSLVRAFIDISAANSARHYHQHDFAKLFEGNVRSLHLRIHPRALPYLSHERFRAFQNLVQLTVYVPFDKWNGKGIFKFLEFSPNLQALFITVSKTEVSFPMEKAPSCLLYQLKEFKVLDFGNERCLFQMVAYILKNATVLEKLRILTKRSLKVEEKFRITKELLRLPRSSNKCQVEAF